MVVFKEKYRISKFEQHSHSQRTLSNIQILKGLIWTVTLYFITQVCGEWRVDPTWREIRTQTSNLRLLWRRVPGCDVPSRVAQAHSVLHDELHFAVRADRDPNPARLFAAAGVWWENVVWSHSVAVVYYSAVNVDGEHIVRFTFKFSSHPEILSFFIIFQKHNIENIYQNTCKTYFEMTLLKFCTVCVIKEIGTLAVFLQSNAYSNGCLQQGKVFQNNFSF